MSLVEYVQLASGIVVPEALAEEVERKSTPPTCVDLFAGCGGFSLGMISAGFDVVAACDNDPLAAITYLYNLGAYPVKMHFLSPTDEARFARAVEEEFDRHKDAVFPTSGCNRRTPGPGVQHYFFGDVRCLRGRMILDALGLPPGDLDCVVGGPPCQGYSVAGKREVMDPRNSLVFEFGRLVLELEPRTLMMENVPGICSMVTSDGLPVLDALCLMLSEGGFGPYEGLRRALAADPGRRGAIRTGKAGGKSAAAQAEPAQQELAL